MATPYDKAVHCTGGPAKGTVALAAGIMERHESVRSLGIYNCRPVRGGKTNSIHGEGRAFDAGLKAVPGKRTAAGQVLLDDLLPHAVALGIQCLIYARTIWSPASPNGRPYGGVAPHWDHAHIEMTREAAASLTLPQVRVILGTTPKDDDVTTSAQMKELKDHTSAAIDAAVRKVVLPEVDRLVKAAVKAATDPLDAQLKQLRRGNRKIADQISIEGDLEK